MLKCPKCGSGSILISEKNGRGADAHRSFFLRLQRIKRAICTECGYKWIIK